MINTLTLEEEVTLITQAQNGNKDAMEKLTLAYKQVIDGIGMKKAGTCALEIEDAQMEAWFGFREAVMNFDFKNETKLYTFAMHCIENHLNQYCREYTKINEFKFPTYVNKIIKILNNYCKANNISSSTLQCMSIEEIDKLAIKLDLYRILPKSIIHQTKYIYKIIHEYMSRKNSITSYGNQNNTNNVDTSDDMNYFENIPDNNIDIEDSIINTEMWDTIKDLINNLPEEEKKIFTIYLHNPNISDICRLTNLSHNKVSNKIKNIQKYLKFALRVQGWELNLQYA